MKNIRRYSTHRQKNERVELQNLQIKQMTISQTVKGLAVTNTIDERWLGHSDIRRLVMRKAVTTKITQSI